MSVTEVRGFLAERAREGEAAGVAVLVRAWHSAPRRPGARFAAAASGAAGSISAGCVEADLREHLLAVAGGEPPRLLRYGIADEDAAAVGLSCGGEIEVLAQAHRPDDPAWIALVAALDAGREVALVTGLSGPILGRTMLAEGEAAAGGLGSHALDAAARDAARVAIADAGGARVVRLVAAGMESAPPAGAAADDAKEALVEPFLRPNRLIVVGAGRIAGALAALAAPLGIPCVVVEPRTGLAAEARAAGATVVEAEPEAALEELGADGRCAVAVVAHDERLDVPALAAALRAGCGYVGLLGGRRTQQGRRDALRAQGLGGEDVARVRGPIGLDIGAESPAEIALSVLAEVLAAWKGRSAGGARRGGG
ncbi:MAG: XdhC family protein [Gemmatimonadota bacterium]